MVRDLDADVHRNGFGVDILLGISRNTIDMYEYIYIYTLPETNIAPENRPSQKEFGIPTIHFQVPC